MARWSSMLEKGVMSRLWRVISCEAGLWYASVDSKGVEVCCVEIC